MRLFAAVELDPAVRAAAAAAGQALRARLPRRFAARWIPEENIHITLWFLGEVDDTRMPALVSALEPPFGLPAFSLEIGGLGAFPPSGPPRVIWMAVGDGADGLLALHGLMAARLEPLGFAREDRPYRAHVTIARVRDPGGGGTHAAVRRVLAELPAPGGPSRVARVTLFRSRLSPKGSTYEPVLRVPLNG